MSDALDERMMRRASVLAQRGRPSPEPHVGAVIVRDGCVLATGYHHGAGLAHAEIDALRKLDHRAEGATLYVTLEPCDHHGGAGPCTDALIAAGILRVVIGCEDRAKGHGGGAARLSAAGIDVHMGVCRVASEALVADFHRRALSGLPLVVLKAALTLDGRMATRTGDSRWITGDLARKHAHRLRDRCDAVMVGIGTVLADDPELTVRHVRGRSPPRVVLDSALRTPLNARVLAGPTPTWIFHATDAEPTRAHSLRARGAHLRAVPRARTGLDLEVVLRELARRDVMRLLVEGGPALHGALLDAGFGDEVALFVAPRLLADPDAMPFALGRGRARMADAFELRGETRRILGRDMLITGTLVRSEEG